MRNMKCFEWLFICSLITLLSGLPYSYGNVLETFGTMNDKVLHVDEEHFKETLPIQNGARLYHLQGLKPLTWYEVKMSYPASMPASFSLQLKSGTPDLGLNLGRKLLNTEKIIFKTTGITSLIEQGDISVFVNVEPEGVVTTSGKREMEYIMFNIVCDELLLGIPHKAWYVTVFVLIGLMLVFVVPWYLPAFLLPKNGIQPLLDHTVTKAS
ncbi:uncharacterized protein LOC125216393 [Salvia hispanica]|uniref:uncharacterized protein LOC125216393 n=1 Tax=Salvia hispanica TaxID=49212 RepID=UPI0020092D67|nr:uncharacterized protein LOC125216393 [Salvia hispanica]XP_047974045.1 uncharacterized protein LOC125216393 [Salvia hispanica]XP_047974046.1 uncharacterized protein LOC125216393 [Salvia hispanica]